VNKIPKREIEFRKIKDKVQNKGGFLTVYMRELREAYGVAKLGPNVNAKISRELRAVGLECANKLTENQWDSVRLYQIGHPAEELINAFHLIDANNDSADQILINACQSENCLEYREAIINIRDVVNGIKIDTEEAA
jgi:hypothetical protein